MRSGTGKGSDRGNGRRRYFFRAGLCLLPLAMTPIWVYLIADGYLDFGGGEKDLIW